MAVCHPKVVHPKVVTPRCRHPKVSSTLLVATPDLEGFQFSPDGERVLYSLTNQKAFTVAVSGGFPVPLRLNDDFICRIADPK
jgi:hypothetical protein